MSRYCLFALLRHGDGGTAWFLGPRGHTREEFRHYARAARRHQQNVRAFLLRAHGDLRETRRTQPGVRVHCFEEIRG